MGKRVLLISEEFFRDNYDVSDSLNSKSVITAIYEAQGFYLATVIGDKFLNELYTEVSSGTLTADNKYLLDNYIQYFLGAQAAYILASKISYKIGNAGVQSGEKVVDAKKIAEYYDKLAGIGLRRLTDYLCKHYSKYTQWLNGVEGIKPHMSASEQTSIFLGVPYKTKLPIDEGYRR